MKTDIRKYTVKRGGQSDLAFTLIELLVVIAIIGILAAMLMTALPAAIKAANKSKAKLEESQIVTAIEAYESAYSRFPVSQPVQAAASAANPPTGADFTYGATFGAYSVQNPYPYQASNAEVIVMLMDMTTFPDGTPVLVNANHQKNPKQTKFLNAKVVSDKTLPGVGPDGVYRDPWGNPYIISMDLNYDGLCEDAFYSQASISSGGLNGLILQPDGKYAFRGKVMVWSAGPDKKINNSGSVKANEGENKDNVISWQ